MRFIVFIILFLPLSLLGQAEYQKVRDLFDKPNADVQISTFKGSLNEVHPITIYIGHKNDQAHGYYRLMSSGEEIWLHGEYLNQTFVLNEQKNNQAIGTIHFQDKPNTEGTWSSISQEHILPLQLKRVRFGELTILDYSKKIVAFSIDNRDLEATVLIEPLYDDVFLVHSIFENKYKIQELTCKNQTCQDILVYKSNKPYNLTFQKNELFYFNKKNRKISFDIDRKGSFETIAYAASNALLDVSYLKTNHQKYNQWIKKLIHNSRKEKIKELNALKDSESNHHFEHQWTGWQEIDYWTDKVISGRMVFYESWTNKTHTIPLIYNLETDSPLDLKSEFRNQHEVVVQELLRDKNKHYNPNLQVPDHKISNFEVMSIVKNGILLSSPFDPIEGYHKTVIPYQHIKRKLRKNSPIHQLLKS